MSKNHSVDSQALVIAVAALLANSADKNEKVEDHLTLLNKEVQKLEERNKSLIEKLKNTENEKDQINNILSEVKENFEKIEGKSSLAHLINKVSEEVLEHILTNPEFSSKFTNELEEDCAVISIDIRRSTELMLKAKNSHSFTMFISTLGEGLKSIILNNFGIFDKFTGDGILAFFPKFFSGEDFILHSAKAAEECHGFFRKYYDESRHLFQTVLKDIGLGIGIDYGKTNITRINNEMTVGSPVVYACRLSGADAHTTLFNQSAKDAIISLASENVNIIEMEKDIKHEGIIIGYKLEIKWFPILLRKPSWSS
ncbi:hypothetical protein LEP1GSC163_2730 [Leptospira santarosai str. CBC379]|uniref:hypothetical protein n=1 Tax=Leptospira santarosai TaxID=28183 RepID=UPI000297DB33|nr:hypothetical protein [Leptospira santarosai]EKR92297.1 hypothetical protein LEP1GSC163_2730 [Leptospira santarosai str. CBC379]